MKTEFDVIEIEEFTQPKGLHVTAAPDQISVTQVIFDDSSEESDKDGVEIV